MLCWPSFPAVCVPQVKFAMVFAVVMVLPAPRVLEVAVTLWHGVGVQPLVNAAVTLAAGVRLTAFVKFVASVVGLKEIEKLAPVSLPAAPPVVVPPARLKPLIPLASVMPVPEGFVAKTVTVATLAVALVVV